MLPRIRKHIAIPVGVGFGIRDAETAKGVGIGADAVVIGSKIIQIAEQASATRSGACSGRIFERYTQRS